MNTVLLGLPTEIKELIYFDALSHAATMILVSLAQEHEVQMIVTKSPKSLPLSPDVKCINPNGVATLSQDVEYLTEFVDTLKNPILKENLDELRQTVSLMQAENSDDFYDVATRNKKYGRVDAMNGPMLLEKCGFLQMLVLYQAKTPLTVHRLTHAVQVPAKPDKLTALSSRFGMKS